MCPVIAFEIGLIMDVAVDVGVLFIGSLGLAALEF